METGLTMAAITAADAETTVVTEKDAANAMADEAAGVAVEMTVRMRMTVDVGTIFVQNHGLSKDPLCLTKILAADVKNNRIITATDSRNHNLSYLTNQKCAGCPHIFFENFYFTGNQLHFSGIL